MNLYYEEQLQTIDKEIEQLTRHSHDYQNLANQLEAFLTHLHSKIMVPITKVAFMEGQLKHSHGVTLLLGDGWFAEMSLYEAREVIKRRLQYLETRLQEWQTLRKHINQRYSIVREEFPQPSPPSSSLSSLNSEFLDIREPLDNEEDISSQFMMGPRIAHKPTTTFTDKSQFPMRDETVSLERDRKEGLSQSPQQLQQESSSHDHISHSELDQLCQRLIELEKIELAEEEALKTTSTISPIELSSSSQTKLSSSLSPFSTMVPPIRSPMDIRDEEYQHPHSSSFPNANESPSHNIPSSSESSKPRISKFRASRQTTSSSPSRQQQQQ
jgi:prefoldin alpha subunit